MQHLKINEPCAKIVIENNQQKIKMPDGSYIPKVVWTTPSENPTSVLLYNPD